MEYPNLPERKLIDIPANSRASRGTCKIITTRWSETKPSKLAPQCASTFIWMKRPQTIWSSGFIWTKISSTYVSFHSRSNSSKLFTCSSTYVSYLQEKKSAVAHLLSEYIGKKQNNT